MNRFDASLEWFLGRVKMRETKRLMQSGRMIDLMSVKKTRYSERTR